MKILIERRENGTLVVYCFGDEHAIVFEEFDDYVPENHWRKVHWSRLWSTQPTLETQTSQSH